MKIHIIGLFLLTASVRAADPLKPGTFFIHASRLKHTYVCAAGVETGNITDGVLHADLHRGGDRFLLVSYSQDSHPGRPNGHCGSGIESYLVWLQIRGSTVISSQTAQYESCWHDIQGGDPTWKGQFCTVEYSQSVYDPDTKQSTTIDSKATFDAKAPDKGLQIVEPPKPAP